MVSKKGIKMENNFELPINEVSVLMGIGALGIITVITLFIYLVGSTFFGKNQ